MSWATVGVAGDIDVVVGGDVPAARIGNLADVVVVPVE